MRRRSLTLIATAAVAGLITGSCSLVHSPSTSQPVQKAPAVADFESVSKAVQRTAAVHSLGVAVTIHFAGGFFRKGVGSTLTEVGSFDLASQRGDVRVTIPGAKKGQRITLQAVFDRSALYEQFPPAIARDLPGHRPWVKLDLPKLSTSPDVAYGPITGTTSGDPTRALQSMFGANKVWDSGQDILRGVHVHHFLILIDLNKAAARLKGADRAVLRQMIRRFGMDSLPADIWVDGEGFVRKVQYTLIVAPPPTDRRAPAVTMDFSMEMYDFGKPVHISVPPAGQVTDITPQVNARQV